MPLAQLILFALLFTVVIGFIHAYLGWRLVHYSGLKSPGRKRTWFALAVSVFLIVGAVTTQFLPVPRSFSDLALSGAYFLLGALVLTWSFVIIRDIGWFSLRGVDRTTRRFFNTGPLPEDPERRRVLFSGLNVGVLGASALGVGYGYLEAKRLAKVVNVEVPIRGLPDGLVGFTIAQISDIHIGPNIKGGYLRAVVERVNGLKPDLIALTGDLVDGSVDHLRDDVSSLRDLKSRHGTFFVTGNHEYYSGAEAWCEEVTRLGLRVLQNEHLVLDHEGSSLLVAGVTDYTAESILAAHRTDPAGCVEGAPDCDARLLLAHQPLSVHEAVKVRVGPAKRPFDLQLSGHTHGGQFIPWNLLVGLANPVNVGLKRMGDLWVYVNRGTGYWGPPLRLGVPAEITRLRLVRA